ncbi:hypothetical protein KCP91_15935 [Microvirga sp. SRT01]|uniref:Uncharacterized protein n=1 Tax=Sphingomonas longa TaxID=2778730 RepID=A0ABS2DAB4_9SPHN|nr:MULTISPECIES: hypothetical protein [Alphaproteobacteria]MBM6577875.1 hypothetical protein [Sphingomonas sp. BT552]MBR7710916.1 hypothetical protein [Microvirga sp. SRT01]
MNNTASSNVKEDQSVNPWLSKPKNSGLCPEGSSALWAVITCLGLAVIGGLMYWAAETGRAKMDGTSSSLTSPAKRYIASLMRDPSSAQFQNVVSIGHCIRGEVNGRNAFGGYVGFSDFYFDTRVGTGAISPMTRNYVTAGDDGNLSDALAMGDYLTGQVACARH